MAHSWLNVECGASGLRPQETVRYLLAATGIYSGCTSVSRYWPCSVSQRVGGARGMSGYPRMCSNWGQSRRHHGDQLIAEAGSGDLMVEQGWPGRPQDRTPHPCGTALEPIPASHTNLMAADAGYVSILTTSSVVRSPANPPALSKFRASHALSKPLLLPRA